ncbi:ABC transporter permease, partial [Acinetobacter baumannii]
AEGLFVRLLGEIGLATLVSLQTLYGLLGFFGAIIIALFNVTVIHPGKFRFNATVQRFEVVGVTALGIIGLMSFLIGLVIAQQGAVQLRQFG